MGLWTRTLAGLLLLAVTIVGADAGDVLKPGETVTPDWEGGLHPPKVYLPAGEAPASGWPLIIFYHGMGGKPDVNTMLRFAGNESFVILGMPYLKEGPAFTTDEYLIPLQDLTDMFRGRIEKEVKIDKKRIVLAGFSKGGFYAAYFGTRDIRGIAGICMLSSYLSVHNDDDMTRSSAYHKAATYIGMGTDDRELSAKSTYDLLTDERCEVFLDEWVGVGHTVPKEAPYLNAWFGILAGTWENKTKDGKDNLVAWSKAAFMAADKLEGAARYTALLTLMNDPRFPLCTSQIQNFVKRSLDDTVKNSEAAADLRKATLAFKDAEDNKVDRSKKASIETQRAVYTSIIEKYPDSPEAIRCKKRIEWLDGSLKRLEEKK